jgi:hypothetical protein
MNPSLQLTIGSYFGISLYNFCKGHINYTNRTLRCSVGSEAVRLMAEGIPKAQKRIGRTSLFQLIQMKI